MKSQFPLSVDGAKSQRKRWEEGHIGFILTTAPRLIFKAIAQRNLDLLALTFDLAVPPLSLLFILLAGTIFVSGLAVLIGLSSAALIISASDLVALAMAIFFSWLKYGRDVLPPSQMFSVAKYVFAKLPLYRNFLSGSTTPQWTRTDRKKNQ